jgi:TetR/AcrR family transcriptional regulator
MADFSPQPGRLRQARVAQILQAATEVFAAKGFDGTTMADIAQRAALPKANIHYYFGTKENIYRAVLDDILELWLGAADHWISADRPPAEALDGYIRAKILLARDKPDASRIYATELISGAAHLQHYLNTALRRRVHGLSAVIDGWIAAGRLRPVSAAHLLFCIWAMTQTYADFSLQIGAVLDTTMPDDAVFETAATTVASLILKSLIIDKAETAA